MKKIKILLIVFTVNFISADSEKLDPIIFMLDLSVVDSKNEEARKFTYEITKKVIANEPDTVIYQYFFSIHIRNPIFINGLSFHLFVIFDFLMTPLFDNKS